jgi:hypothetical protein
MQRTGPSVLKLVHNQHVAVSFRDGFRDDLLVDAVLPYSDAVRFGYARVSGRSRTISYSLMR